MLVVARYDRFSRIQIQQAIAIYQIEHLYGGRVESADPKEQYGRDSTSTLLRNIAAWRAEQELELIRERTQGGRRSRALSGKLIPTVPLYGYTYADPDAKRGKTRYVIDPETASVVKRIYQEIVAGISLRRIAQQLNQENVPTPAQALAARGYTRRRIDRYGMWTRAMVLRIATHPGYCGRYAAFRYESTTQDELGQDGKMRSVRHQRFRAEDDPTRITLPSDVCPAIVSEEQWDSAREQLRVNRVEARRNNQHGNEYLLRGGHAVCGYCGHRMYAYVRSNKKQLVYRCGTATQYGAQACAGGSFTIQQALLDEAVWKAVMWVFREPERIRAVLDMQRRFQDEENAREEATRHALQAQVDRRTASAPMRRRLSCWQRMTRQ